MSVAFQEVVGTLHVAPWSHPVLVIAEDWPSFSFAAQAAGCLDIFTWCLFKTAKSKVEFLSTRLGCTLVDLPLDEMVTRFARLPHLTVLIQGSPEFSNRSRIWVETSLNNAKTLEVVPASPTSVWDERFLWKGNLSHQALGGVTTGVWSYRSSEPLQEPSGGIQRNLGLVLKPIHGGRAESKFLEKDLLDMNPLLECNLIPPGDIAPWVKTPSVFLQGKEMVVRRLQADELLDVYDTEVLTQKELGRCWRRGQTSPSFAFAKAAPMKVVVEATRLFYDKLREDGWAPAFQSVHESNGSRKRAGADTLGFTDCEGTAIDSPHMSKRRRLIRPDVPVANQSLGTDVEDLSGEKPLEEIKGPSLKATKNDDAKVNEKQWDVWSVNNFLPDPREEAKICVPGSYCESKHGRLFGGLRILALRWYRRKILRSFLAYLRTQYADNRVYTENLMVGGSLRQCEVSAWVRLRYKFKALIKPKRKQGDKGLVELKKDLIVGSEAVWRATQSSWWNWDGGSTIYFWRWSKCYRMSVRDGTKAFVHRNKLPSYSKAQQLSKDKATRDRVQHKVNSVRSQGYINKGGVKSITGFFDVPKGEDDIRMVYDATKCGLNAALWTPNFFLPTIDTILRNADEHTWFGDIDLGEMFLNYWLDEELRPYAGVDVSLLGERVVLKDGSTEFINAGFTKKIWERWERTLMGFQSSPYLCTQAFGWSEDFILGELDDHENNPLAWKDVVLNLPGSKHYSPTKPWLYRVKADGSLAAFFGTYMDDIRTGDSTESSCRRTTRRVASRINYLGQQDAPRKRRAPSKKPGAWAGAMCKSVTGKGLFVTCSQEKWDKAKEIVSRRYTEVVVQESSSLSHKELEKDVGFLVHLSRTFPSIFPYLRGIYNTLNGWRSGRDRDGWKLTQKEWELFLAMEEEMEEDELEPEKVPAMNPSGNLGNRSKVSNAPSKVKPVPRLGRDLRALNLLFSKATPPERLVRGQLIHAVKYAFGDASKAGFGSSWISAQGVKYRFGTWGRNMQEGSSNLRELKNLVDTLKKMAESNELEGSEIYIFTDNSTAEAAFFKGLSKSRLLFELILELRELEMNSKTKIHFIHVAGTRMIAQGSDGLSRGNISEGVMKGSPMESFIPLNESALDRSPALKSWLASWTSGELEILSPRDWFIRGHDIVEGSFETNVDGLKWPRYQKGCYVWAPPPAAAEVMLEELRKARHRRTESTHVILIPRLMGPAWQKHLHKVADIVVSVPVGHPAWPTDMHEPLTMGIVFPFFRYKPWRLRRSPILLDLEKQLRTVWKTKPCSEGSLLRKLWSIPGKLAGLSQKLVWKMLRSSQRDEVPDCDARKRRRLSLEKEEG